MSDKITLFLDEKTLFFLAQRLTLRHKSQRGVATKSSSKQTTTFGNRTILGKERKRGPASRGDPFEDAGSCYGASDCEEKITPS